MSLLMIDTLIAAVVSRELIIGIILSTSFLSGSYDDDDDDDDDE